MAYVPRTFRNTCKRAVVRGIKFQRAIAKSRISSQVSNFVVGEIVNMAAFVVDPISTITLADTAPQPVLEKLVKVYRDALIQPLFMLFIHEKLIVTAIFLAISFIETFVIRE